MINVKDNVILNDRSRKVTLVNMNWFFVVTLAVVIFNIVRHTLPEGAAPTNESPEWNSFSLENLFIALSRSYMHSNWQHCLLNMLCFSVAGVYIERKKGSLGMLLLVFTMSLFTAFATAANYLSPRRRLIISRCRRGDFPASITGFTAISSSIIFSCSHASLGGTRST